MGCLFGVTLRPVRVEACACETIQGYQIWQLMEESIYAWRAFNLFIAGLPGKKEAPLKLN